MHFFPNQGEQPFFPFLQIAFQALHPHVVVADENGIQAGLQAGSRQIRVFSASVGIYGMHVQGDDDFFHVSAQVPVGHNDLIISSLMPARKSLSIPPLAGRRVWVFFRSGRLGYFLVSLYRKAAAELSASQTDAAFHSPRVGKF